ncbi:MAG TPA: hypothetical protein PKM44_14970 [Turneriella sp.]|nr:hypothetical protein [Turneriella sp.]HNE21428.1 hypothetical protein [Turneriella sp.]HNJ67281.1 hypothetical protein [Turneriella sp.]HNL11815.1 hypothetical protein [Turneriella sp.]
MKPKFFAITLIVTFALGAGLAEAKPPMRDDNGVEVPTSDTKKKPAGSECKSTVECRQHHRCAQSGEKKVCTPPASHLIPPT